MYIKFNMNPKTWQRVGDCVIRAISKVMGVHWDTVYIGIALKGLEMKDMPSSNEVWSAYLKEHGYKRYVIPNYCPDCYSIRDFAGEHPYGRYIVATGTHVVAVIDGDYYDIWDSGNEIPIYYFVNYPRP